MAAPHAEQSVPFILEVMAKEIQRQNKNKFLCSLPTFHCASVQLLMGFLSRFVLGNRIPRAAQNSDTWSCRAILSTRAVTRKVSSIQGKRELI